MKKSIFLLFAIVAFQLTACSPESANLFAQKPEEVRQLPEKTIHPEPPKPEIPNNPPVPRDEIQWISVNGGQSNLDFNPQIDILFVIDNSGSMKAAQENLANSIDSFAQSFQKNKLIDYHLGVVTVWDSHEKFVKHPDRKYDMGELLRVKNSRGAVTEQRFLTRETGNTQALKNTIYVGLAGKATRTPIPEFEEVFSPIAGALHLTGRGAPNEGFFRPDAHLVVILLSDADDTTSGITPEQIAEDLLKFKGDKASKLSVYGALVKKSDADEYKDYDLRRHPNYHKECFDFTNELKPQRIPGKCDDGFGPENFEKFIIAANPDEGTPEQIKSKHIMSLVQKNFGADLAKIGSRVTAKTLAKEIQLPQRPRVDPNGRIMVQVRYGTEAALAKKDGGQIIPENPNGGWTFDPENNSIRLSGDISYQYEPGSRFAVDMVPVTLGSNE